MKVLTLEAPFAGATEPNTYRLGNFSLLRLIEENPAAGTACLKAEESTKPGELVFLKLFYGQGAPNALHPLNEWEMSRRMHELHAPFVGANELVDTERGSCLVYPFIEGVRLDAYLEGPNRIAVTCDLLRQAGEALAKIHAAQIFHGDFGAHNLMVSRGGKLHIIDAAYGGHFESKRTRFAYTPYTNPLAKYGLSDGRLDAYPLGKLARKCLFGVDINQPNAGSPHRHPLFDDRVWRSVQDLFTRAESITPFNDEMRRLTEGFERLDRMFAA